MLTQMAIIDKSLHFGKLLPCTAVKSLRAWAMEDQGLRILDAERLNDRQVVITLSDGRSLSLFLEKLLALMADESTADQKSTDHASQVPDEIDLCGSEA